MVRLVPIIVFMTALCGANSVDPSALAHSIKEDVEQSQDKGMAEALEFLKAVKDKGVVKKARIDEAKQAKSKTSKNHCEGRCAKGRESSKDTILVFVSLSMPDASLKQLYEEAQLYKGRLVMRGLVGDSWIKTKQAVDKLGIAVDIDPPLFEEYQITEVPTFVKVTTKDVLVMKGNVTLAYAANSFRNREGAS